MANLLFRGHVTLGVMWPKNRKIPNLLFCSSSKRVRNALSFIVYEITANLNKFDLSWPISYHRVNLTAPLEAYRKSIVICYLKKTWNSFSLWVKINILIKMLKIWPFVTSNSAIFYRRVNLTAPLEAYRKSNFNKLCKKKWNSYYLWVKINILIKVLKIWPFMTSQSDMNSRTKSPENRDHLHTDI